MKGKQYLFDYRGIGGSDQFNNLRAAVSRGINLLARPPDVHLSRPIQLLYPHYRVYIVPRPNQIYLVGASEIESEDTSSISVRTCLELLSAAYSVSSRLCRGPNCRNSDSLTTCFIR